MTSKRYFDINSVRKGESVKIRRDQYKVVYITKSYKGVTTKETRFKNFISKAQMFARRGSAITEFKRQKQRGKGKSQFIIEATIKGKRFTAVSDVYFKPSSAEKDVMTKEATESLMKQLSGEFTEEYSYKRGLNYFIKHKKQFKVRQGFRTFVSY